MKTTVYYHYYYYYYYYWLLGPLLSSQQQGVKPEGRGFKPDEMNDFFPVYLIFPVALGLEFYSAYKWVPEAEK
jgi:hypothetical protein